MRCNCFCSRSRSDGAGSRAGCLCGPASTAVCRSVYVHHWLGFSLPRGYLHAPLPVAVHDNKLGGCAQHTPLVPNYPLSCSLQSRSCESVSFTDAPAHYWAQYTLTIFLPYFTFADQS